MSTEDAALGGDSPPVLDAAAITARARAAYGSDGRLPTPDMGGWDIFPYEEPLVVKRLADPQLPEPDRFGAEPATCATCAKPDEEFVWAGQRWRLGDGGQAASLPVFWLHPRPHLDLPELSDAMAREMGLLTVALTRRLTAAPGVGRVHVNKWGDGGAHLHLFVVARPAGMLQLRGSPLPDWLDALPAMPGAEWAAWRRYVAAGLIAAAGGTAYA